MGGRKNRAHRKIKQVWRRKEAPPPPWTELPRDITANILQRLGAIEILESAQKVCTTWHSVCKDPAMWRVVDMSKLGDDIDVHDLPYDLEIMCRHAVNRSEGQLIDISIAHFSTNQLLKYIAERSGQLRSLRLSNCYELCYGVSHDVAKSFPLLEELHLFYTLIPSKAIEEFGHSCPLLKSFTLNNRGSRGRYDENDDVFAVAKNMPELRHLRLFGNKMSNEGLQAILDGCPNLESLDLRQCFNLNLGGDVGQRCSQQIKDLRRPNDSTSDYEFDADIEDDYYDSFDDSPSGFSDLDLNSDYDEYYLDYDDFTRLDYEGSDYDFYEDIFGF